MKKLVVKGPSDGGANFGGRAGKAGMRCGVDKVGPRYVRRPKAQFGDHWRTDGSWERHKFFLPVVSQCFRRYGSATVAAIRKLVARGGGDEGSIGNRSRRGSSKYSPETAKVNKNNIWETTEVI